MAGEWHLALSAPDQTWALHDARATLADERTLLLEGTLHQRSDGLYRYQTHSRTGVYAQPSKHALVGVVPPGEVLRGSAPSSNGWIALDDDESWMLDDGSLALVGRPAPSRPRPFAKRVALPADVEARRATSKPLDHGGLLVTAPRHQKQPEPRRVPINVTRQAPAKPQRQAPAAPAPRPASRPAESAPTARPKEMATRVSAEEYKQQHKRHAAERRGMHEALRSQLGDMSEGGALLIECEASDVGEGNVQMPSEQVEEWVAITDGGFVRREGLVDQVMSEWDWVREPTPSEDDERDELAYYGF